MSNSQKDEEIQKLTAENEKLKRIFKNAMSDIYKSVHAIILTVIYAKEKPVITMIGLHGDLKKKRLI